MPNENKNAYLILGLLSHNPITGYEIKKVLNTTLKLFWNASYGSIYPTLSTLEKSGFAVSDKTEENGREKIIYSITESGREYLKEWLQTPAVKDELKYETLLKLFFCSDVSEEEAIEHIERFEEKISAELPYLEKSIEICKAQPPFDKHKYFMLTAMFGKEVYETYLKWCEEAKKILREGKD